MNPLSELALVAAVAFLLGFLAGRWRSSTPRPVAAPVQPLHPANDPQFAAFTPIPTVTPITGDGPFQIYLADGGSNAIRTIKAIRAVTRLGLKDAKDLHDRAPAPLVIVRTAAEADAVQREFLNIARLEVAPIPVTQAVTPSSTL